MSTISMLSFFIPSAIKAGYQNHVMRKNLMQLPNGVYYYTDRKGNKYVAETNKRLYTSCANAVDEDGKEWWNADEEKYKKAKETAIKKRMGGYITHIPRCGNNVGLVEFVTGKVIARLTRTLEGECKKFYMYDSMVAKYGEELAKSAVTLGSPKWNVRKGDKGILISEREFESFFVQKYIGYCVDVYDEKDHDCMARIYGWNYENSKWYKDKIIAIQKKNGTYKEPEPQWNGHRIPLGMYTYEQEKRMKIKEEQDKINNTDTTFLY